MPDKNKNNFDKKITNIDPNTVKYCFLDLETTYPTDVLYQLTLKPMVRRQGKYIVQKGRTFNIKINDTFKSRQFREEHNKKAVHSHTAFKYIIQYLDRYIDKYNKEDKFVMIAHNAKFDHSRFLQFFKNNGSRFFHSYFDKYDVCTYQLAKTVFTSPAKSKTKLENLKLSTIADYYKIKYDPSKLHTSPEDTLILSKVFKKLISETKKLKL